MRFGTILQFPLILLVFISFGVSIYAISKDLVEWPTVIILGIIIVFYIIGFILNTRKQQNETTNNNWKPKNGENKRVNRDIW